MYKYHLPPGIPLTMGEVSMNLYLSDVRKKNTTPDKKWLLRKCYYLGQALGGDIYGNENP